MHGIPKNGFIVSVILHLGAVLALIVFTFFKPPEKPIPTVFELVSAPPPSAAAAQPAEPIQFEKPPQPLPPPIKRPEPPPPKPPEPKPIPKPVPKPPPAAEVVPIPKPPPKLSYEQFLEQQGPPKTRQPLPTNPKPVTVPRIDTKFSANLQESVIDFQALEALSGAEQSALDRYISRLREALRRNWEKPSGVASSISAEVEFNVSSNGRLTNVRITRSSGNRTFDQSVREAFDRLGSAGATPNGKPQELRITFRMTDA
jgi:protein TonB